MELVKQFLRLLYINYIFAKNGLDKFIVSFPLFSPLFFLSYFNPWNWFRSVPLTRAEAIRKTLEELGPIFVKFGQALSTRPDILPADIAFELCKLQDNVPSFSSDKALSIIEAAYGRSVFEVFSFFNMQPLASASMAQVHAAKLSNGQDVVVKILRPNMRKIIDKDLSILKAIAHLAEKYWVESRRFKPKEIVLEFEQTLLDELDLHREAANGGQLRRNFKHSPLLYIPEIHWDYVRENILVMERIYGIPVADVNALKAHGVNIPLLAERGLEIFFTQVFRDCFFHADMHPGNIFVSLAHPENPQYICIDFGIVGTLNDKDMRYLAENLLAFFNRDYRRVAQLHIESGWVASTVRVEAFESAIRTVCEPISEKPLKDISFAQVLIQLFSVARRFQMEVQPQLVLLQKTLFAVEGLGRQLCPDLDLWLTAKPFLEKWVRQQVGPKAFFRHLKENIPFMVEQLPHMPRLLNDVLLLQKEQQRSMATHREERQDEQEQMKHFRNKGFGMGIFVAMLLFAGLNYFKWNTPLGLTTLALGTAGIGGMIGFIYRTKRS